MEKNENSIFYKREAFILFVMLILLHVAIWYDFTSLISKSLMLSHLGMFLIWQPVWRGDERLSIDNTLLFFIFTLTFTYWLNYWLLFAWLIILIGFISGRVAFDKNERISLMIALSFLVMQLLFACVPKIAGINIPQGQWLIVLLPALAAVILFFPGSSKPTGQKSVDFIHAITTAMLTALVALGSVLTMFLGKSTYFIALTQTTLVIGVLIICISWLLTSRSEFSGVLQLWSSYMLNIGTPLEQWLSELSMLNDKDLSADEFLQEAMTAMVNFSWISGVSWSLDNREYQAGTKSEYHVPLKTSHFACNIYIYNNAGMALKLHCDLLIKLLNDFYSNKLREEELTRQAHLKAIYETGARITHDIKNLLQSLQAITSLIGDDSDNSGTQSSQQILRKQLPNLTQRLQMALDKLQSPTEPSKEEVYLKDWWRELKRRHHSIGIKFHDDLQGDPLIPLDLFDSVTDNLLENAHNKMLSGTNVRVSVTLVCTYDNINLSVCDSGARIDDSISRELLKNPVHSDNGLGIGLYQASRHALLFNYKLKLLHNEPGRVCFELSNG
ncbi:MAG: hypothetical protein RLT87_08125 [Gammaproteobacteria bacterium]